VHVISLQALIAALANQVLKLNGLLPQTDNYYSAGMERFSKHIQ
jgi:hypothetical protein